MENITTSIEISEDSLAALPRQPGCYIFKKSSDEQGDQVLYVGKAKSLRDRVRNYFVGDLEKRAFAKFIRSQANVLEFIVVGSNDDALVLENELIKKYKPPYNILLKDDKRFLSLRLDLNHEWPRVEVIRKIKKDGAVYLGPFSSSTRLRETLNIMQKIFPLRSCPDSKLYNRSRPCIEYDIKRCVAPCVDYIKKPAYKKLVNSALLFLKGESEELLQQLERQMQQAASEDRFEDAAKVRDQIASIQHTTLDKQSVVGVQQRKSGLDQDALGFSRKGARVFICLVFIRSGMVWDQRTFEFSAPELDDREVIQQFISRYYSGDVYLPHELLLPFDIGSPPIGLKIDFIQPRSEEKKRFLDLATKNADIKLKMKLDKTEHLSEILASLQSKLKLHKLPVRIDCLDISHHQGTDVVASVVRFKEAVPDKSNYRKIKLKTDQVDDYASMREAIARRYKSKDDLPELMVVDGGKGQLSAAEAVLKELGFFDYVELVSLAKARRTDQEVDPLNPLNRERVFKLGRKNPILLKEASPEELLLSFLRDEAHRFAITYHRLRKDRALSASLLDEVEGLGNRNKIRLLKKFGSLEGISSASDIDLLEIVKPKVLEGLREKLSRQTGASEEDLGAC